MDKTYTLSADESERIDIAKVLMCIGVLFLHSYSNTTNNAWGGVSEAVSTVTDYISNTVCDCAVPVFMLISSVLLYSKDFDWTGNMRKKMRSLAIPYFVFNTLWILAGMIKTYVFHRSNAVTPDYLNYSLVQWLDAYFGIYGEFKPALSVLWYLRDLFLLNGLAVILKKIIDKFPKLMLAAILLLWFSCAKSFIIHIYALVPFCLGYYIVKFDIHMDKVDGIRFPLFSVCFVLLTGIDHIFQDYAVIHRFTVLVEITYVFALTKQFALRNRGVFHVVAPCVFFLYLTHRFVYMFVNMLIPCTTVQAYAVMYFVKPFFAVTLGASAFYFLQAYCPRLLVFLTGGRIKRK